MKVPVVPRLFLFICILLYISECFGSNVPSHDDNVVGGGSQQSDSGVDVKEGGKVKMINQPQIKLADSDSFLDRYLARASTSLDTGFTHAFIASLSVILVSEIADKTFFIAAIMAMRHPRVIVFAGAITALAIMTILSVFLGYATTVIPRIYTFYISTALFAIFGIRMLKEGYYMSKDEGQEEMEEVQADLKRREDEFERKMNIQAGASDVEAGSARTLTSRKIKLAMQSHVFLEALTLTFLAEWGDRSQLATIILGARENVVGVTVGGILGHSICTALAVIGGRFIASKISPRTVTLVGGVVFLLFALSALIMGPGEEAVTTAAAI